jgi:hypothetical protein
LEYHSTTSSFLQRHFGLWKLVCVASLLRKVPTSPYGTSNDDNLIRSASAITSYAPVYESPTQQSWNDSKFEIQTKIDNNLLLEHSTCSIAARYSIVIDNTTVLALSDSLILITELSLQELR